MTFLSSLKSLFTPVPRIGPTDAVHAIRAGEALLIDVREPGEWSGGVAADAALLPLSDLTGAGARWNSFLDAARGKMLLPYCASGGRSAIAARLLAGRGFRAVNAGGFREWQDAGWPVVTPGGSRRSSKRGQ